jgi:hypothetical protein
MVVQTAKSLPCSDELVAVAVLVTLGSAIGNSRIIRVKHGWDEPASIYAALVAESGSMKSPALDKAIRPMTEMQTVERRTWTTDTTMEKLGDLFAKNPHGIMIVRDELIGWVRSCNQYRDGKGSDRENYMSAWSGADMVIDRKGEELPTIVHKPFLSVLGCLPPDRLRELEGGNGEDGFIQRFLFTWPRPVPVRWSDDIVKADTIAAYSELVTRMYELDWQGQRTPLWLTPDGTVVFRDWHDCHFEKLEESHVDPKLRGFYSKLKGYCARLALIHAVSTDPDAEEVDKDSVEAAIAQIEYFKGQVERVVQHMGGSVGVGTVGTRDSRIWACRCGIVRHVQAGKVGSRREAQRLGNHPADIFNPAWDSLVNPIRIVEKQGGVLSVETWGGSKEGEQAVERGTDIPTTDTASDTAA